MFRILRLEINKLAPPVIDIRSCITPLGSAPEKLMLLAKDLEGYAFKMLVVIFPSVGIQMIFVFLCLSVLYSFFTMSIN